MAHDPMVSALQGPPNLTMDALFPPPTHLDPITLMMKGREMLKDPNRPQYDPENVDRPMVPGEEGSPFQGILQPWGTRVQHGGQDPVAAMFAHPTQHLQHMAGEVVPFPVSPQVADKRRINNEDMMNMVLQRFGPPGIEQFNRLWPLAPVVPGPGYTK